MCVCALVHACVCACTHVCILMTCVCVHVCVHMYMLVGNYRLTPDKELLMASIKSSLRLKQKVYFVNNGHHCISMLYICIGAGQLTTSISISLSPHQK